MITGHGGNVYDLARRLGCRPAEIIDASSNINPLGSPPGLLRFLADRIDVVGRLPEVDFHSGAEAFAASRNIAPDQALAAAGTTELIYALAPALKPRRVLVVGPTYADYADACRLARVPVEGFTTAAGPGVPGFDIDLPMLAAKVESVRAELVFVCNPNNPTGILTPGPELVELCRSLPQVLFVVDESYLPFAPQGEKDSLMGCGLPNVLVLHSLSKIYRLPGLRIGFAVGPAPVLDRLRPRILPWSVNGPAQQAVDWLLSHPGPIAAFEARTRRFLAGERNALRTRIDGRNLRTVTSVTSFVLCRLSDGRDVGRLCRQLADRRILLRDCANFEGLPGGYFRISLGTADENRIAADALLAALDAP